MNQEFKAWIVRRSEESGLGGQSHLLCPLKRRPDMAEKFILVHIANWAADYTSETGEQIATDRRFDHKEILAAIQEHFAAELAAIKE